MPSRAWWEALVSWMGMRLTRKVFHDLAIWMVGFGLMIGASFPFFGELLGVPREIALTPVFFAACLMAGALAGILNYALVRLIVGVRLRVLSNSMGNVEKTLRGRTFRSDPSPDDAGDHSIAVDSEDEIGECASSFNRLVEALTASMQTQSAVQSFSQMLGSQLEIEGLAKNALHQFFDTTGAAGGLILYESAGELRVAAALGLRNPEALAVSDAVKDVARTGKRQIISIPENVRIGGVVADFRPNEAVILPVTNKSVLVAIVVLANGRSFDVGPLAQMDLFLPGLGLAINNAVIHGHFQRLAGLDPLTGIYNRRFGLDRLHQEFSRAVRTNTPLGVMMLDLDRFKDVNDAYGHLVGDQVLKSVCAIARSSLREGDVLLRYGGEEFMAILPAASSDDLRHLGERLRKSVEDSVLANGAKSVRVTISIGGAAYPNQNVESEDALIQLADEAMYRAKNSGRNRVEVAS